MTEWILTSSILILVVIALRTTFKGKISLRLQYAIWGLVLVRLLIPFSFGNTNISIVNLAETAKEQPAVQAVMDIGNLNVPSQSYEDAYNQVVDVGLLQGSELEALEYEAYERMEGKNISEIVGEIARTVWVIGIALVGIVFLATNTAFKRKLLRSRYDLDVSKENLPVYVSTEIDTPCLFGVKNPAIYVTYPVADDQTLLRHTLEHEATHHRHGDHIWAVLRCVCLAIHWYNPLVWWAAFLSLRDAELACDEATIKRLGEGERAEYGRTLIGMTCQKKANVLITATTMTASKSGIKERILLIAKKPKMALYTLLIVVLVAVIAVGCTFTGAKEPGHEAKETLPYPTEAETEPLETDDWGISLVPDRVSRTGATALFVYSGSIPGEEGAELTYGDFLSLDRLVDGSWVPCDELAGYNYYVGDSSYLVVDGYGMVHEWPERFGELVDGHYRLGKQVTLIRADGSSETKMVYGEFTLPDSVQTGLIPLEELPEKYSAEQAMIDGCFVQTDGVARENKELFQDFAATTWNGLPGVIRIVNWHYGEDSHWSAMDLEFDGNEYTLKSLENTYTFKYLKRYTGEKAWENADHDAYEYYVLVNDDTITLEDINSGKLDMSDSENPAHWTVYADFVYAPKQPQLPKNLTQAVLEFEGQSLITITDFDRLEKIWILFSDAEFLGYEPKTHSIGVGLNLILTSQSGESMIIELDPDSDLCRINGEYVFYGAYDEPDYIEKLWYYLDIEAWPDSVYEKCLNAYRT